MVVNCILKIPKLGLAVLMETGADHDHEGVNDEAFEILPVFILLKSIEIDADINEIANKAENADAHKQSDASETILPLEIDEFRHIIHLEDLEVEPDHNGGRDGRHPYRVLNVLKVEWHYPVVMPRMKLLVSMHFLAYIARLFNLFVSGLFP